MQWRLVSARVAGFFLLIFLQFHAEIYGNQRVKIIYAQPDEPPLQKRLQNGL